MRPTAPNHVLRRRRTFRRVLELRPRIALIGALTVLCVAAAACGGGGGSAVTTQAEEFEAAPEATTAAPTPSRDVDLANTRPGAGLDAAGGDPSAVRGADPCRSPGSAAGEPLTIAYVGTDLAELGLIGSEMTVVEDPIHIISAYVNEVNFNGGIDGRCVELEALYWSLADPIGSYIEVCSRLSQDVVFYFNFRLYDSGLHCSTFGEPVPSVGLYTTIPESAVAEAGYVLYADDGSVEHLLSRAAEVGLEEGVIASNDRVALLHGSGPSAGVSIATAEQTLSHAGVSVADTAHIPPEFGDLGLLLPEQQARLLQPGLSEDERGEARRNRAALSPEHAELLAQIEEFYTDAAARFRDAGVTVVAATSHWADVRRMMRAAESIDWTPTWLITDVQPATLVTSDTPDRQAQNLRQVSSRRAAGDVVPALDQGCIILRNTASGAEPFTHRPHTDAWNLITSVCDYLDVTFSALTRIDGPVNHVTFLDALNQTHYEAEFGGLITFGPADRNGAERFRVLQPDSGCVLNYWGCMRSTTGWLSPVHRMDHSEIAPDELMPEHQHGGEADMGGHEPDEEMQPGDMEHGNHEEMQPGDMEHGNHEEMQPGDMEHGNHEEMQPGGNGG